MKNPFKKNPIKNNLLTDLTSQSDFYEFYCPVKIVAGHSALEHIPFELGNLNSSNPLIITDKGVKQVGLLKPVLASLEQADVNVSNVFDDVPPDSSLKTVKTATQFYRDNNCDAIIAIGGGSVIDTSKAVNILVTEGGDDLMQYAGVNNLPNRLKPFIMIPTTAGTGSEVTAVSVISDTIENVKMPFMSSFLLPDIAVLDPRMTLTLPPHLTAMTAMDALTHSVEAYTCLAKNPMSDAYATSAIKKISANLPLVIEDGQNTNARLELAQASTMAGIAFSNSMVGLVHSLGHSLGAVAHLPHGLCMNLFLPYVLEYNFDKIKKTLAELLLPLAGAEVYSGTPAGDRAQASINYIKQMRDNLHAQTKLPRTLSETKKVTKDMLEEVADKALDDGSIIYNPRETSKQDLLDILNKAWQ